MERKIHLFEQEKIWFKGIIESFQGWQAYARWANTYKACKKLRYEMINIILNKV